MQVGGGPLLQQSIPVGPALSAHHDVSQIDSYQWVVEWLKKEAVAHADVRPRLPDIRYP